MIWRLIQRLYLIAWLWNARRAAILLLPLTLYGQKITYSTGGAQDLSAVAWRIVICNAKNAPAVNIPQGVFFQHLALHGAKPLTNVEALAVFDEAPSRSIAGRIVTYAGYAAVGAGFLMTTNQIKVSEQTKIAVSAGGAFLTVLVPLVQKRIPQVSPLRDLLIGTAMIVPANGGCATGVMLGAAVGPVDFEVTL